MQRYKKNVIYTNFASCQPHKSSFLSIALNLFFSSLAFSSLSPTFFSLLPYLSSSLHLSNLTLISLYLVQLLYGLFISSPFSSLSILFLTLHSRTNPRFICTR